MMTLALVVAATLPVPGRSVAASQHGVAASSQPLAAQAAVQILQRGGNAVDAAIAANSTQGVMEPTSNGIGGDLFAIVYLAKEDKLYGVNASGWSPAGMTLDFLHGKGVQGELPYRGVYSVTVPGAVAGWAALHKRFGKLPLATDLAPAIWYAERGFPVMEVTAGLWSRSVEMLGADPESRATFLIEGRSPRPGEPFRNPALARSLRRVAENGRDGFYKGPAAQAIVDLIRERGGVMTLEDLAEVQPEWVEPIDTIYLTVVDGEGNIVSLIQSNYAGFGSGLVPKGGGFMLQNRGALFTLQPGQPNTIAGRKRPLHTIIPAFMQKGDVRIGFGIMGGWNQAQAHAQFVSNVVDFGMTIQQALEAGRFTKATFEGCDVEIEASVPQQARDELAALGHHLEGRPLRTPFFGYAQAGRFERKTGLKFGASDPRHDGEAIPVPASFPGP